MKKQIIQTITNDNTTGGIIYAVIVQGKDADFSCYYCIIENYSEIDDNLPAETVKSGYELSEDEALALGFRFPVGLQYQA